MATEYFPGTNIPISSFKGSDSKKDELIERLQNDMAAGDIDGMNDAIFSVAYYSKGGQGQGQGNANVSKIHNGTWEVTADVGDNRSWAETAINSENDVYIQKDGSVITYDDDKGAAKDGVSSGTWGGQGTGENNPHSGDAPPAAGVAVNAPVNPVISGGGGNSSANYAKLNSIWDGSFADEAAAGIGDYGKTDTGTRARGTTGLGGLMLGSDYRRSAPLDWSSIMPQLAPLQSQQAIQSGRGKYYQPWATRQATPVSLINYQKPTGPLPALAYQPPGSPVTSTYTGNTGTTDSGTTDSGTTDSGTTDSGTTDSGATSGVFMGQNYANQGEYMMLLDTHNKAMQLIRGGRTTRGIGDLMSDPGWVNTEYVKFGGTDLGVGGKSGSIFNKLLGTNNQNVTGYPDYASGALASDAWGGGLMGFEDIKAANQGLIPAATTTASSTSNGILPFDFY